MFNVVFLCYLALGWLSAVSGWVGCGLSRRSFGGGIALTPRLPVYSVALAMTSRPAGSPSVFKSTESQLTEIRGQIAEVAASIKGVQRQLVAVGEKFEETKRAFKQAGLEPDDYKIMMMELQSLMDDRQSLMDEKKGLMDDKNSLLDKEHRLMGGKNSMRDKEAKLMEEEEEKAKQRAEGVSLTVPAAFNFNVASWQPGSTIDCSVLSDALAPFGGFPSTVYVREEMLAVWSIVVNGIAVDKSKWVIFGSPGVGKSMLTVLMCFHLARTCNKPVFLARQLKGEDDAPLRKSVAICFHPGVDGKVVGFPTMPGDAFKLTDASDPFQRLHGRPVCVLDGWSQQELSDSSYFVLENFGNFNLLATSGQYMPKCQDTRSIVLLPAWRENDLEKLWKHCGPADNDGTSFVEKLYYSGGSARELMRPNEMVCSRIKIAVGGIREQTCKNLLAGYGGSPGEVCDRLRRCHLDDKGVVKSYTDPGKWLVSIDSAYALKQLSAKAPLSVYTRSLAIAKGTLGGSLYGSMFEVFVHYLSSLRGATMTFHLQDPSVSSVSSASLASVYAKTVDLVADNTTVECIGSNGKDAMTHLRNWDIDLSRSSYWHPDYPSFPAIDAVLVVPAAKEVHYLQITAGAAKEVNSTLLNAVHDLVKQSLTASLAAAKAAGNGSDAISQWSFFLHTIGPSLKEADALKLSPSSGNRIGDVLVGKGYMTYSASS